MKEEWVLDQRERVREGGSLMIPRRSGSSRAATEISGNTTFMLLGCPARGSVVSTSFGLPSMSSAASLKVAKLFVEVGGRVVTSMARRSPIDM